jgi:glucose-6-phosphate isomerase
MPVVYRFPPLTQAARPAAEAARSAANAAPFSLFPSDELLGGLEAVARRLSGEFSQAVVLGMGGATLNPQAILSVAPSAGGMQVFFFDHVDPHAADALLERLDFARCCFLVVSKSGRTLETVAQYCFFRARLRERGLEPDGGRFVFVTEEGNNPLRKAAEETGAAVLAHPRDVGGRFAGFTAVGLLPALLAGADVGGFIEGGRQALRLAQGESGGPAAESASFFLRMLEEGLRLHVAMNYVCRMAPVSRWYCQIWAESLGKGGFPVTPVAALGTQDQHSQLQHYLGGAEDKFYSMIGLQSYPKRHCLSVPAAVREAYPWLDGKDLGAVHAASFEATCRVLAEGGRPLRTVRLRDADAFSLGAFMMHSMLEVVAFARLIGVNPFDQPHVEEGKRLTRAALEAASS